MQEAEIWLSRVDQSPPDSTRTAIRPMMDALVREDLLNHPHPGVKVGIACCLTEVTRVSAPDPPYDDDVMRVSLLMMNSCHDEILYLAAYPSPIYLAASGCVHSGCGRFRQAG